MGYRRVCPVDRRPNRCGCTRPTASYRVMPRSGDLRCTGATYGHRVRVPEFDPGGGGPGYLYMAVADHLAKRIEAGELVPGAMLPGERDLAQEYGVALGTIRRATGELRERGLVMTLPAKGTFVREQA